jgi:hypothetical protein
LTINNRWLRSGSIAGESTAQKYSTRSGHERPSSTPSSALTSKTTFSDLPAASSQRGITGVGRRKDLVPGTEHVGKGHPTTMAWSSTATTVRAITSAEMECDVGIDVALVVVPGLFHWLACAGDLGERKPRETFFGPVAETLKCR